MIILNEENYFNISDFYNQVINELRESDVNDALESITEEVDRIKEKSLIMQEVEPNWKKAVSMLKKGLSIYSLDLSRECTSFTNFRYYSKNVQLYYNVSESRFTSIPKSGDTILVSDTDISFSDSSVKTGISNKVFRYFLDDLTKDELRTELYKTYMRKIKNKYKKDLSLDRSFSEHEYNNGEVIKVMFSGDDLYQIASERMVYLNSYSNPEDSIVTEDEYVKFVKQAIANGGNRRCCNFDNVIDLYKQGKLLTQEFNFILLKELEDNFVTNSVYRHLNDRDKENIRNLYANSLVDIVKSYDFEEVIKDKQTYYYTSNAKKSMPTLFEYTNVYLDTFDITVPNLTVHYIRELGINANKNSDKIIYHYYLSSNVVLIDENLDETGTFDAIHRAVSNFSKDLEFVNGWKYLEEFDNVIKVLTKYPHFISTNTDFTIDLYYDVIRPKIVDSEKNKDRELIAFYY